MSFASTVFRTRDLGLQQRRLSGDGHLFGERAGLQREVDGERAGRIQLDVGAADLLEAAELDDELVAAGTRFGKV